MSIGRAPLPGPLFILNGGDKRPLMPAGAAQRRIARGRGVALYHPAFDVIQLTHTYTDPSLQACYLAIRPQRRAAEFFVVAEGTKHSFPLLYVVLDLELAFGVFPPEPSTSEVWPDPVKFADAVADVIAALQQFIPLSHAVPIVPGAFEFNSNPMQEEVWLQQVTVELILRIAKAGLALYWKPLSNNYQPRHAELELAMADFVVNPQQQAAAFVARHGRWPYLPLVESTFSASTSEYEVLLSREPHRGELYCVAELENKYVVPGIVDGARTDNRVHFWVPGIVGPLRIWWELLPARKARRVGEEFDSIVRFFRAMPVLGPGSQELRRRIRPPPETPA